MLQKEQIKHTGATFTPFNLAEYLAQKLIKYINYSGEIKVLDPACGEGELLFAMGKILSENKYNYSLTGYDSNDEYLSTAKKKTLIFKSNQSNFILSDFLEEVDLSKNHLLLLTNFEAFYLTHYLSLVPNARLHLPCLCRGQVQAIVSH